MKPRIGVTGGAGGLKDSYRAALEAAGADVVELIPGTSLKVDGLLLTGGPDIEPAQYGQKTIPETGKTDEERDAFEIDVLRRTRAAGQPVLGICRGQQLVAVAFEGSLTQHVPGHKDRNLRHPIRVEAGSRLRQLTGHDVVSVNSRHHQVVDRVPEGFHVSARSNEGYPEGLESDDGTVICVQCHPEDLPEEPWAKALFADLVARAAVTAASRPEARDQEARH